MPVMCRYPNFTSKMRLKAKKRKTSRTLYPSRWNGVSSMGAAVCGERGNGGLLYEAAVIVETAWQKLLTDSTTGRFAPPAPRGTRTGVWVFTDTPTAARR